jgi:endoglucanase
MKKLLQKLSETPGPSGFEQAVRAVLKDELEPLASDIRIDALGNLIAHKAASRSAAAGQRIIIAAPMDETGLMASHVDERGFVHFAPIGPVIKDTLPGGHVQFMNGTQGLVGSAGAAHGSPSSLFIDVGAGSRKECPVNIGDAAVFQRSFHDMGEFLAGRSLAGRASVLVAIEALRMLESTPNDLYMVFTAQEQVGSRGALVSSYGIEPELAITIGAAAADDVPGSLKQGLVLGKGPAIKIRDASIICDPQVVSWMVRTAEKNKIPCQREVNMQGSSAAARIQASRAGVLAGAISLPVRYLDSACEMLSVQDLFNAIKLLAALLRAPAGVEA